MRFRKIVAIVGVGLWFGLGTQQALAQSLKIGYVDAAKILEDAPQSKASLTKLEAEFGPREQELRKMRDNITRLENELDKNSLVMSDSDREKRNRELLESQRQLRRAQQDFREEYNLRRNEELADLQRIVSDKIIEIAKSEGYDLIMQQVVYASKKIDITDQVLKRLGNK